MSADLRAALLRCQQHLACNAVTEDLRDLYEQVRAALAAAPEHVNPWGRVIESGGTLICASSSAHGSPPLPVGALIYTAPAPAPVAQYTPAGTFRELPSAMQHRLWEQVHGDERPGDVTLYECAGHAAPVALLNDAQRAALFEQWNNTGAEAFYLLTVDKQIEQAFRDGITYAERAYGIGAQEQPLTDEQRSALQIMLAHYGDDERVACLHSLAAGIGAQEQQP